MNIDWLKEAEKISDDIYSWREFFHKNPELGNNEFKTAEKIEEILNGLNIKTQRILGTAVIGLLEVEGSKTCVAIRSDIDALPIKEETGLEFSSINEGIMHACGHDIHIVGALAAAKILSIHKDKLKNSVKFFFQPNEEGDGGAKRMIDEGAMQNPYVSFVSGAHVQPHLPLGSIGLKSGPLYAYPMPVDASFIGKSAHAAKRHLGKDALAAAAYFTTEILKFNCKLNVVTVGSFHSGKVCNIIADKAEILITVRSLTDKSRSDIVKKINKLKNKTEKLFGVQVVLTINMNGQNVDNPKSGFLKAKKVAEKIFKDKIHLEKASMYAEDFGNFIKHNDGCFFHIGVGGEYPLHNSHFAPDTKAAFYIAAMHAALCSE